MRCIDSKRVSIGMYRGPGGIYMAHALHARGSMESPDPFTFGPWRRVLKSHSSSCARSPFQSLPR